MQSERGYRNAFDVLVVVRESVVNEEPSTNGKYPERSR
jgi:hypothetical protein